MSSLDDSDPETITRILFLSPLVHIYAVPPLSSNKGYSTTSWTPLTSPPTRQQPNLDPITTRLRVIETSSSSSQHSDHPYITTTIQLEEKDTGALFAACPYTSPSSVLPVTDSTRFFALRVEGEGGRKAVLGVGFEERTEAMDFGICLQGARRVLGIDSGDGGAGGGVSAEKGGSRGVNGVGTRAQDEGQKKDWGLKEGEMIRVEIGGKGVGSGRSERKREDTNDGGAASFTIKPPPSSGEGRGGGLPFLPPPPSAKEVKEERRRSRGDGVVPEKGSAADLGFDDGEFGEFQ
ncbi:MAG: hypothetical protein Q9218_002804 [Villophora microphyllina]